MPAPVDSASSYHPFTLGELLDRSARFWRVHLRDLFVLCLGFHLPQYIALKAALSVVPDLSALPKDGSISALSLYGPGNLALFALGMLAIIAIQSTATLALATYAGSRFLGNPVSPRDVLSRLRETWGRGVLALLRLGLVLMLWTFAISIVGVGSAYLLEKVGILGRIAAVLIIVMLVVFAIAGSLSLFLRYWFVPAILGIERTGVRAAFRRSRELLRGSVGPRLIERVWVRASIGLAVATVVMFSLSILTSLPQSLVKLAYGSLLDARSDRVPQVLLVPAEIFQTVGQAVFEPLVTVILVFMYFDLRARREGLDLELSLRALGSGPAA